MVLLLLLLIGIGLSVFGLSACYLAARADAIMEHHLMYRDGLS